MGATDRNQDLAIPSEHASKPPKRQLPTVVVPYTPSCSGTCEVLAERAMEKAMRSARAHFVYQETCHAPESDPKDLV